MSNNNKNIFKKNNSAAVWLYKNWNKKINAIFTFKNLKLEKIIDCDNQNAAGVYFYIFYFLYNLNSQINY